VRVFLDSVEKLGDLRFQRLKNGIATMMAAVESAKDRVPRVTKLCSQCFTRFIFRKMPPVSSNPKCVNRRPGRKQPLSAN
jgi:hypothetical protein